MHVSELRKTIWAISREIAENMNNIYTPIAEQHGLTLMQVRILLELLNNEEHTVGRLGKCVNMAGGNISAMCKKLEKMGLVKRSRSLDDERVVKVSLTKKGFQTAVKIEQALNQRYLSCLQSETEETLNQIILGLQEYNELLKKISLTDGDSI